MSTKSPLNIIYTSGHYGEAKLKEHNFGQKYEKIKVFGFSILLVCRSVILRDNFVGTTLVLQYSLKNKPQYIWWCHISALLIMLLCKVEFSLKINIIYWDVAHTNFWHIVVGMTQIKSYIVLSSHILAYLGDSHFLQKSYMVRTHHELATILILVLCVIMGYISHKTEYPSFYDFVCRTAYFMPKSNNQS